MCRNQHIKLFIASVLSLFAINAHAQRVSVSTDPLKWATASANIDLGIMIDAHWTIGCEVSFNPFDEIYSDLKLTHVAISPEVKYWFQRPQYSHFIGLNPLYTIYDVALGDHQYKGRMAALGVTYGYGFILSRKWSFVPTIGVGYGYVNNSLDGSSKFTPTITKFGVGFSYIID